MDEREEVKENVWMAEAFAIVCGIAEIEWTEAEPHALHEWIARARALLLMIEQADD